MPKKSEPERHAEISVLRGKRFKDLRAELGLTQAQAARRFGISVTSWQRYESGQEVPNGTVLSRIAHTGADVTYLLTGEQAMPPGVVSGDVYEDATPIGADGLMKSGSPTFGRRMAKAVPPDFVLLPKYDVRASAGPGSLVDREDIVDVLAFRRDWIRRTFGCRPEALTIVEATGDSMEPTICEGDLLLIAPENDYLAHNTIHVVEVAGTLLVKRVLRHVVRPRTIVLSSDNKRYPDETISWNERSDLHLKGRVLWVARVLDRTRKKLELQDSKRAQLKAREAD